jgi:plastocyanin
MSIWMRTAFVAVLLSTAMACAKGSSPTSPSPTSMTAMITSSGFAPDPINISVGSTVTWANKDTAARSIVADGGAFSSGSIAPGAQYSYTFPAAGTFKYHDGTRPSVVGTVVVSGTSTPGGPY